MITNPQVLSAQTASHAEKSRQPFLANLLYISISPNRVFSPGGRDPDMPVRWREFLRSSSLLAQKPGQTIHGSALSAPVVAARPPDVRNYSTASPLPRLTLDVAHRIANNPQPVTAPRYPVTTSLRYTITIPADHPSLPGHFPGHPVVPGAVILAEVIHVATGALGAGARIAGLPSVKFVNPMLPGQRCELIFTDHGVGSAAFELTHDTRRVASGNLRYQRPSAKP